MPPPGRILLVKCFRQSKPANQPFVFAKPIVVGIKDLLSNYTLIFTNTNYLNQNANISQIYLNLRILFKDQLIVLQQYTQYRTISNEDATKSTLHTNTAAKLKPSYNRSHFYDQSQYYIII